jgi:Protein of unknown function (DUF3562)
LREIKQSAPATTVADDAAVATLAQQTDTAIDLVKSLYDQEIATLQAQATVKNFLGVIASRRVKRQLRELGAKTR